MRRVSSVAALLAALALAGCGGSPPTRFLTLDPAPPAPAAVRADYRGPALSVSAMHLPAALDRLEYAAATGSGGVKVSDFDRWAAPPGTLARDALVQDLVSRLPNGSVLTGAAVPRATGMRLDVVVLSLDGANGTMEASYQLVGSAGVRRTVVQLSAPGASDPAAAARTFATLLGLLADRVVADLPAAPLGRGR